MAHAPCIHCDAVRRVDHPIWCENYLPALYDEQRSRLEGARIYNAWSAVLLMACAYDLGRYRDMDGAPAGEWCDLEPCAPHPSVTREAASDE